MLKLSNEQFKQVVRIVSVESCLRMLVHLYGRMRIVVVRVSGVDELFRSVSLHVAILQV
jgi:hypothetical protein